MTQCITQKGNFDSAHRVMNEKMKCFHLHGHTYLYELTYEFESMESIGYAIDFKEIKRVAVKWIDDNLDHGFIANPHDTVYIEAVRKHNNKIWLMSINGPGKYCNPTVENIAKEVFIATSLLFDSGATGLKIKNVRIFETPNCFTDCNADSVDGVEKMLWKDQNMANIAAFKTKLGTIEYDDRKTK